MVDYFDEDDLINDYIADVDEGHPSPPYQGNNVDHDDFMEGPPPPDEFDDIHDGTGNAVNSQEVTREEEEEDNFFNDLHNTNENIDDADKGDGNDDRNGIPKLISTKPPPSKSTWRDQHKTDLYDMERYTGHSSWRGAKPNYHGDHIPGHGASIMEATAWKKRQSSRKDGNDHGHGKDDHDDSDDDTVDNDNLDKGRTRIKRPVSNSPGGGKGSEAQLVRFLQRYEAEVLGRSWGRMGKAQHAVFGGAERFLSKKDEFVPDLGDESLAVTLANGKRTYVKRIKHWFGSSKGGISFAENAGGEEGTNRKHEDCLLGLPMSELVRRADNIERRAIKRKLEREEHRKKLKLDHGESHVNDVSQMNSAQGAELQNDNITMQQHETNLKPKINATRTKTESQLQAEKQHKREMQLQQRLWVDKHAPTSISHLLSDERTNREVLRALRAWDPYVFKREAPKRPTPAYLSNYGNRGVSNGTIKAGKDNKLGESGNGKNRGKKGKDGSQDGEDIGKTRVDVRPDEHSRVILLSGPPGVGKSTLAHIVCRHAGYRAIEVNASDERSAAALNERVTRAMESSTLNLGDQDEHDHKSGKPNCIILDEIDGADAKASIQALVEIIRAEIPPSKGGSSNGKRGKTKTTYLRRPIILICNHKHAPALRPILPYAKQFDVQPPNPERLTSRLNAVLAAENMSVVAGSMLLHRLVSATGGDVRSCLYALQFASARARELALKKIQREGGEMRSKVMVDISSTLMAALGDTGNGMKDMQSDVSTTVATVFRKLKSVYSNKRQKTASGISSSSASKKGIDLVLKAVDHFGDNSKTLDCLFMNLTRVAYVDPTLDRCAVAFEWLSEADTYRSHKSEVAMNNSAEHQSMQKFYIPSAAAAIHLLCCVETRPDLTFSTRPLSDLHYRNQANISLVHRFVEGLAPRARRGVGGGTDVVVADVIPYGLWLLSAGEGKHSLSRPVSSVDILTAEEKNVFSAHVETLRALGLTYVKESHSFHISPNPNAPNETVRLEPEIDRLVKFEHVDEGFFLNRRDIPSLLKELLAHGATLAGLRERESESKIALENREKLKSDVKVTEEITAKSSAKSANSKAEKAVPVKKNSAMAKNFLGVRAAKSKEAKSARRAARVAFDTSKKI
ncbi:hypothetical protein ACHAXS_002794, partial [Conticribra weissflogii]